MYFFDRSNSEELSRAGQRVATMLLYLSTLDQEAGGGTWFPHAKLRVQPTAGSALLWYNTRLDGRPDPQSMHASEPVRPLNLAEAPVKWVLSKWLRVRRFPVDIDQFKADGWGREVDLSRGGRSRHRPHGRH